MIYSIRQFISQLNSLFASILNSQKLLPILSDEKNLFNEKKNGGSNKNNDCWCCGGIGVNMNKSLKMGANEILGNFNARIQEVFI